MRHPFENLTARARRNAYWAAMGITFVLIGVLQTMAAPYIGSKPGEVLRYNIFDFELARTVELAQTIVDSWGPEGRAGLARQTMVDYLFLLAYSNAIALGILAVLANTRSAGLLYFGRWLAWLQWLAAGLDAVENYALLQTLKGTAASPMPEIAFWCATPKFIIVVAGIFFVLIFAGLGYTRDSERGIS